MGHVRLGTLPKTRAWKEIVRYIADGADVSKVAGATMQAADKAFEVIQNDRGFAETVDLMTQLAVAARSDDPVAHFEALGIKLSDHTTVTDVALAIVSALDKGVSAEGKSSDFGEIAQHALVSAVIEQLNDLYGTLLPLSAHELETALADLGNPAAFGRLSRSFFSNLTNKSLDYFLSKTIGTQIGEGQRFATMNQVAQFKNALETHCREASEIVQRFSADWFSKIHYENNGHISKQKSKDFGWFAMEKMRSEMKKRAKPDAS